MKTTIEVEYENLNGSVVRETVLPIKVVWEAATDVQGMSRGWFLQVAVVRDDELRLAYIPMFKQFKVL